jgi:DNA helicase HerA-like ATPase
MAAAGAGAGTGSRGGAAAAATAGGAAHAAGAVAAAATDPVKNATYATYALADDGKRQVVPPPVHLKSNLNVPVYRVAVFGTSGAGKSYMIRKWVAQAKEQGLNVFKGGEFEFPMETFTRRNPLGNAEWNMLMREEGAQLMYASFNVGDPVLFHALFNEAWGVTLGADGSRSWTLLKGKSGTAHPIYT